MKEAYKTPLKNLYKQLNTSQNGLSKEQAKLHLSEYGANKIKRKRKLEPIKILISQFNSFLIYILLIAAVISFLIGHFIDGMAISVIIVLNSLIGFFQQYKAEKAILNLRKMLISYSRVLRDGKQIKIPSTELVPGDIILLEAGDKISADIRILEAENTQTNEASLTGESLPVAKLKKEISKETPLQERENMLFAGTTLVIGFTRGLVVGTGSNTVFGQIAESLQEIKIQKTPMQKRLDKFSKQIGFIILAMVTMVILLGLTVKFELREMFFIAVALAVSAIPEGLPAVLAISFAISSIAMSKKNVIIKRLPAVESLVSVTVICSDKTGTLTKEELMVEEIFTNDSLFQRGENSLLMNNKKISLKENPELLMLLKTSALCNNSRFEKTDGKFEFMGDPTENALLRNSLELGLNKKTLIEKNPSIKKFEFDSTRKMMSIARTQGRNITLYSKGAIGKIIFSSTSELVSGQIRSLTLERKQEILKQANVMEKKALRVLGFAYKDFNKPEEIKEENLVFLGFLGMIDPPRPEVKDAINECKKAGIEVKIITGDSLLTAKAIANKIGITGRAVDDKELRKMSDKELSNSIKKISIFARITPEQKLRITNTLKELGETVAITGDGINDVLALKSADVGIAMGKRGTDVARDVSDIVLIDDNFASIVEGVKQGRRTYDNIKKFTKYLLAVNFSAIFLILFALMMKYPLPLLPLQILWMNLISDSFPSLSLVFEKQENVMNKKPRREKSIISGVWKYIIISGIFAFAVELILFLILMQMNYGINLIRTMMLTTAILYELFFVYTVRSKLSLTKIGIFSNKWLNYAVLGSLVLHLILVYTSLGSFFDLVPLTLNHWTFIIPFSISGLVVFEAWKLVKKSGSKEIQTSKNIKK